MTSVSRQSDWTVVDEGWGRKAVDFAALSEPGNCREYVAMHHRLGVSDGDRLVDVACGAGLAIELARARGASCAGIDASPRLIAVARDRNPDADIQVGDMHAMPWADESFDVATSFRGIWGTTPEALGEIHRVLASGGRFGLTVWGHIKVSSGCLGARPFPVGGFREGREPGGDGARWAGQASARRCSPNLASSMSSAWSIPFAWEFSDPEMYARALASTGPAYEAIQNVGEAAFMAAAMEEARGAGSGRACP